jgi:hypothetical protein
MKDKKKYDLSYNMMYGGSDNSGSAPPPSGFMLNKALRRRKKRGRKGDNSGSNRGNITFAGISKLKKPPSSGNSATGNSAAGKSAAGKSAEYEKAKKRAEEEVKKRVEELKREMNKKNKLYYKQQSKNRKRERIKLAKLTTEEQHNVVEFIEDINKNQYTKDTLMKNFCKLKNEGIRDNIVVNLFIPKFIENIQELHNSLKDASNLNTLERNYYEFEARYKKIFKVFYKLQINFYDILKFTIDLNELFKLLGVDSSKLDKYIKYINENGFNLEVVLELEGWINTFKKYAREKFEDLDLDSLQEQYELETESDMESILKEFFLRTALLNIKEEVTIANFKKIKDTILLITHENKVPSNIVQLKSVLEGDGNIKTFYEKYDIGYFSPEEKEEVEKLVVKLGEELEPLKLKYDEDIRALVTEKKKEEFSVLDNELQSLMNSKNLKLIDKKEKEIKKKKEQIKEEYEKIRKNLEIDYVKSQSILFKNLEDNLKVIHKNATIRFIDDSEILKKYFEQQDKFEKKMVQEEQEQEEQEGGGEKNGFKLPTKQTKAIRRMYKKQKKEKRKKNEEKRKKNEEERKQKVAAEIAAEIAAERKRINEEAKSKWKGRKSAAQLIKEQEQKRRAAAELAASKPAASKPAAAEPKLREAPINTNLRARTLELAGKNNNETALSFREIGNYLPIFIDYYTKFFYPLEFLLAEYKKIITSYNELFTDVLQIKDKLYFYIKIYNRLKSKDPSNFSCTLAYISFQILNIDEIIELLQDNDFIQDNFIEVFRDYCKNTVFSNDISANSSLNALKKINSSLKDSEVQKLLLGSISPEITRPSSGALVLYSQEAAEAKQKNLKNLQASQKKREENDKKRQMNKISRLLQGIKMKVSENRELNLEELRNIRAMKDGLTKKLELEGINEQQEIQNYLKQLNINKKISNEQRRLRELEIVGILYAANNLPNDTSIPDIKKTKNELIKIKESNSDILTESNIQIFDALISRFQSLYNESNNSSTFENKYKEYNKLNKNTEDLEKLNELLKNIKLLLKIQEIPKDKKRELQKDKELIKARIALSNRKPQTEELSSRKKSKKSKKPKKPINTKPPTNDIVNNASNTYNISQILANLERNRSNNNEETKVKKAQEEKETLIKRALKTHQKTNQKLSNEEKRIEKWIKKFEKYQILYDSFRKNNQEVNKNNFDTEIKEFLIIVTRLYCIFKNRKPFIEKDFELSAFEIKNIIESIQTNNKNEFIHELIMKLHTEGMDYLNISTDSKSDDKRFIVWKRESKMNKMLNIERLLIEIKNKNSNNKQLTLQELKNIKEMKKVLNKKLKDMSDVPREITNYLKELNINTKISEEKRRMRELEIVEILHAANNLPNDISFEGVDETLSKLKTIRHSNNSILTESNKEIIDKLIVRFESIKTNRFRELQNKQKKEKREKERARILK